MEPPNVLGGSIHFGCTKAHVKNEIKPMYYLHVISHAVYNRDYVQLILILDDMHSKGTKNLKIKQILMHILYSRPISCIDYYNWFHCEITSLENKKIIEQARIFCLLKKMCDMNSPQDNAPCLLNTTRLDTVLISEMNQSLLSILSPSQSFRRIHNSFIEYIIQSCICAYNNDPDAFVKMVEDHIQTQITPDNVLCIFKSHMNGFDANDITHIHVCIACILSTRNEVCSITSNVNKFSHLSSIYECIVSNVKSEDHKEFMKILISVAKYSTKFYNISLTYYISIHIVVWMFCYENRCDFHDHNIECMQDIHTNAHDMYNNAYPNIKFTQFNKANKKSYNNVCTCVHGIDQSSFSFVPQSTIPLEKLFHT